MAGWRRVGSAVEAAAADEDSKADAAAAAAAAAAADDDDDDDDDTEANDDDIEADCGYSLALSAWTCVNRVYNGNETAATPARQQQKTTN